MGLVGERALIASIIAVSVDDALGRGDPEDIVDARHYFADGRYQNHLELLGLPANYLPMEFENG